MDFYAATTWIWLVFFAFWLLASFNQKRSLRRQSFGSRRLQLAIVLVALVLIYMDRGRSGILRRSFLPHTAPIQAAGLVLLLIGLGFAVWARFTLGRNWSGVVTVKEDHVLVTRGPYAWVRHPIYTGILLALLGTAGVTGRVESLLVFVLVAFGLWLKLRTEERFMMETFGEQYAAYRQRVKALVPCVI